jgi:hypothetical protein
MAGGIEDELAHVRENIQRLARLRYQQRGFTDDQQAEYEALIARRDALAQELGAGTVDTDDAPSEP